MTGKSRQMDQWENANWGTQGKTAGRRASHEELGNACTKGGQWGNRVEPSACRLQESGYLAGPLGGKEARHRKKI